MVGTLLVRMRRLEEAFPHLQEALEGRRRFLGDDHPYTLMSISDLGNWFRLKGRPDEAHRYHREAIERARRTLSPEDWKLGRALYFLGQALVALDRYEEAEDAYLEAFDNLVASRGAKHSWPRRTASRLVELFELTGDERKRTTWQARLAEIEAG
jgi:tetratricopeptide (TPR) repeat protein